MTKGKKYNYVYVTTNIINGKKYVGDHSTNNIDDGYLGSGNLFCQKVIQYGKENFVKQILEYFPSKELAFDAQEKYIRLNESHISQNGYNISWKGGHNVKECWSDESKEKCSITQTGKIGYWKDKKLSEQHKSNLTLNHMGMKNKNHSKKSKEQTSMSMKDIKKSQDHKDNIRQSMKKYWEFKKSQKA